MSAEDHQRLEQMASAIEDLLYMGAIRIGENGEKAIASPQFSLIVANVMDDMKIKDDKGDSDELMKLMYYSLLIFMNEHLKLPKSFMMAFGNDLEKNRETMDCGALVTTYVAILSEVWAQNKREAKKS